MSYIEQRLTEVGELQRTVREAEAEAKLRDLIGLLTKEELFDAQPRLRAIIDRFTKKRRKRLHGELDAARSSSAQMALSNNAANAMNLSRANPTSADREKSQDIAGDRRISIREIEARLAELATAPLRSRSELMRAFAFATLGLAGVAFDVRTNPIEAIFFKQNPLDVKRPILACLARLIAHVRWISEDQHLRVEAIKLFDEVWKFDVYAKLHVDINAQGFEKWQRLENAAIDIEQQLESRVRTIDVLAGLGQARQELMRILNSALAKAVVWQFVPRDLISRLDGVFAAGVAYSEAKGAETFRSRDHVRETVQEFLDSSADEPSSYARTLEGFAKRVSSIVERDFANSPLSKGAEVRVQPQLRRYPLQNVGNECRVRVVVECLGPGHAFDVELEFEVSKNLRTTTSREYLGNLEPGQPVEDVVLTCLVVVPSLSSTVSAVLRWVNLDKSNHERRFSFELEGQPAGIDWEALDTKDPYSLEPVTEADDLVGRVELLKQLVAKLRARAVGSFVVYGQKRVGKTSLVRSLGSRLAVEGDANTRVVYLEGGDYVLDTAPKTIAELGRRLCEEVRDGDRRLAEIPIPNFEGALSPIDAFLRSVIRVVPDYRIVFVLDEFDELPVEMYRRGPIGDAFFLTLRSISAKGSFGFVIVGGEKMEFILSTQGDALNKFQTLRVDYFDREKHWADFQDLVRRPTRDWLEISDEALVALYDVSAGNPFFAKLVCNELFLLLLQRRDAFASRAEVQEAVRRTLATTGANRFQHFWEDGIFAETGDQVEERSMLRRHLLLGLADLLRRGARTTKAALVQAVKQEGVAEYETESELTAFERRQVLVRRDDQFFCKVHLFGHWLQDRGVQEIVTTLTDRGAIATRREREEQIRVSERELQVLTDGWGTYKGRTVGPEDVRAWLGQFGGVEDQRLIFKLLQSVRFYRGDGVRSKMREAHGIVERHMAERRIPHRVEVGQRKRKDIIVGHLGGVSKSGIRYGQLYAEENSLLSESVIELDRLSKALDTRPEARALVFVDDFLGSGRSAIDAFKELERVSGEQLRQRGLLLFYAVVAGFAAGAEALDTALHRMNLPVKVHMCDPLTDADKAFSSSSPIFDDLSSRDRAQELVVSHGARLVKNAPLGFGDCQALVVFEANCPNNSLPILWAEKGDWRPLFRRL